MPTLSQLFAQAGASALEGSEGTVNSGLQQEIQQLVLSGLDLGALANWPDALIVDYLEKGEALLAIAKFVDGIVTFSAIPTEGAGDGTVSGDVNATDWTDHSHAVGKSLVVLENQSLLVAHKGIVYQYVGRKPVKLGIDGDYASVDEDYIPISTSDHNILDNRDLSDQHPIDAITGLEAQLDLINTHIDTDALHGRFTEGTQDPDVTNLIVKGSTWYSAVTDAFYRFRANSGWIDLLLKSDFLHSKLPDKLTDGHPDSVITVDPTISGINNQHDLNIEFDDQIGLRETASTGVIVGGLTTPNGLSPTNTIDVASGSGEVVDGYTDRRNPTRVNIGWVDQTIDITALMIDTIGSFTVYVAPNLGDPPNSTISFVAGFLAPSLKRTNVLLAIVFYRNGVIDDIFHAPILSNEVGNTLYDYLSYLTPEQRASGLALNAVDSAISVWMDDGTIFGAGANVNNLDPTDPNLLVLPQLGDNITPYPFDVVFEDGTVHLSNQTVIPKVWESAPNVATNLVGQQATLHYMFRTLGGTLILQIGQIRYNNGKDARDASITDFQAHRNFDGRSTTLFSGQVYLQANSTDFDDPTEAGIIGNIGGAGGNAPSVTSFLALNDVLEATYTAKARNTVVVNDIGSTNGDALVFEGVKANFRGKYTSTDFPYLFQDMVLDGVYLASCIAESTSTRPAPQPIGSPIFALPDPAPWVGDAFGSAVAVVESIHEYTLTKDGWLKTLRVWSPAGSASPDFESRIYVLNVTDPDNHVLVNQINNPILSANAWTDVSVGETIVLAGQILRINFLQVTSADGVNINGGWQLGSFNSNGAPATSGWNSNNNLTGNATLIRIDKTDLDGTDRSGELDGIVQESTIRFVQTDDTTKSADFIVATPTSVVDQGTYFDITVNTGATEGSGGRPDDNAVTTMDVFVPVSVPTEYVVEDDWWTLNQPSFATVEGILKYDGVDQPNVLTDAFGIDVEFQEASVSPDWQIMAITGGGGGGGGGAGGGGVHVGATPPTDKVATPIWLSTVTGKTLTWYVDEDSTGQWLQDVALIEPIAFASPIGKNYIINPDFSVNQRGFAGGAVGSQQFAFDRWISNSTNGVVTLPDNDGFVTISGAVDTHEGLQQRLEGINSMRSKVVTMSWEGTSLFSYYEANSQVYTAPAPSPVTFTLPATIGNTSTDLHEFLLFKNGTLKNVKLELGEVATPFEYPDNASELDKCQRYYQVGSLFVTGHYWAWTPSDFNNRMAFAVQLRTTMRAIPTVTTYDLVGTIDTVTTLNSSGGTVENGIAGFKGAQRVDSFMAGINSSSPAQSAHAGLAFTWTSEAEL